jgi:hypothetical protein
VNENVSNSKEDEDGSNAAKNDQDDIGSKDIAIDEVNEIVGIFLGDGVSSSDVLDRIVRIILNTRVPSVESIGAWRNIEGTLEGGSDVEGISSNRFDFPDERISGCVGDDSVELAISFVLGSNEEVRKRQDKVDAQSVSHVEHSQMRIAELERGLNSFIKRANLISIEFNIKEGRLFSELKREEKKNKKQMRKGKKKKKNKTKDFFFSFFSWLR